MAARMYTEFSQRKIGFPKPPASPSAGKGGGSMNMKQAFTSQALPGKPSNWYKVGGKVVDGYASRKG